MENPVKEFLFYKNLCRSNPNSIKLASTVVQQIFFLLLLPHKPEYLAMTQSLLKFGFLFRK